MRSPVWPIWSECGRQPSSVTYTPGEPAPDAPVNLMGMLRDMGAAYE